MQTSTSTSGQLSLLEIFVNRRSSSDYQINNNAKFQYDDSYNAYGKYFDMDTTNGLNKIYVSSYKLNSNPTAHKINTLQVWTHKQVYTASSDTWSSVTSGSLSINQQDTSSVTCSANVDSTTYQIKSLLCIVIRLIRGQPPQRG